MPAIRLTPPQDWPTLGWGVIDWIETYLAHGPGDVHGEPFVLDDEWAQFILDAYRLHPKGHERAYERVVTYAELSRPKGRAKSELAGAIVCAEALGPVRFDGLNADGEPVGRPVRSPFIRCLATEETQTGNTYDNVRSMLEHGIEHHPDVFAGIDVGLTRVFLPDGGEIRPSTASASSKDGGKETFAVADETHLYVLPELRQMHRTVARNLRKRKLAQPWMMATTTSYEPGQQSIAEQNREEADRQAKSKHPRLGFLWDHREGAAIDSKDWGNDKKLRASLVEAYGEAAGWIDIDRILTEDIRSADATEGESRRYWLNQKAKGAGKAVDPELWKRAKRDRPPDRGATVVLGFDGSQTRDATALIGVELSEEGKHLFEVQLWERPRGEAGRDWSVPRDEVRRTVRECFERFDVRRLVCDPPKWQSQIDDWAEEFGQDDQGDDLVIEFWTNQYKRMGLAVDRFLEDLTDGLFTHDGSEALTRHALNAVRGRERGHTVLRRDKETLKIDALVAAVIAYDESFEVSDALSLEPVAVYV